MTASKPGELTKQPRYSDRWIEQTHLDFAQAEAAKKQAMDQVEENAALDWLDRAYQAVAEIARLNVPFTTDDLWASGLEKPREPRALGAVMHQAARLGWIRPTGRYVRSAQVSRHNTDVREWIGCRRETP